MREENLDEILRMTVSRLQSMVDVNYTVGAAVKNEYGDTIIPISKMTVAFVHGGGEYGVERRMRNKRNDGYPFAGGTGAGCIVEPVGFLIVNDAGANFMSVKSEDNLAKVLKAAEKIISILNIKGKENENKSTSKK